MASPSAHRFLLVVVLTATGLAGGGARSWAQGQLGVQFHAFQDSRGVTVLSPAIDLAKDFTDRTGLQVRFGVDAISAASDSCARCHPEGANMTRVAGGATLNRRFGDTKLSIGGAIGQETFYQSATILTSITRNLNQGNTTVAGGYSFTVNRPTMHPSEETEKQVAQGAFVSLTQNLSRSTVAQVGYELGYLSGYLGNPFLRVPVNGQLVLGNVPDLRIRQTLSARLRQALPASTYLEADFRYYFDDWSVRSNTVNLGLSHYFTRRVLTNFSYRWYRQTGAYFYEPEYFGDPLYYTADFRLVPFNSNLVFGQLTYLPRPGFWHLPTGTGVTFQYERYWSDTGFQGAIFSTGLQVPLGGGGGKPPP